MPRSSWLRIGGGNVAHQLPVTQKSVRERGGTMHLVEPAVAACGRKAAVVTLDRAGSVPRCMRCEGASG